VYGTSKKLAEDIAKYYCRRGNMSLNIVRLSDVYGKINISEKVLQIFIRNAVQGIPIVVKQPQAMFYFSHIKDICASLLKITMDDEGGNNDCITKTHRLWPYLGINLLELAKLICKISGSNSQIIVDHDVVKEASANQPEEQKVRYIDYQSLLSTSIEDGICELINSVI
ncbi:MAG TPA: NAD(P)-dependent oxidoreductase, partial [Desulfobacterales bacterium]|nr:NAD(P)-dependent oxidoreductase [Desulfobacterales bacterium]